VIDMAVPRDVEASAADLQNVFLYNLDDLAKIAEANRAAREEEIVRCRAMLAHRADGLWNHVQHYLATGSGPTRDSSGRSPDAASQAASP
jgi:glutamyl-tRNA reductase